MSNKLNLNNFQMEPINLSVDISLGATKENVSGIFTAVPIYEVIILLVLLILSVTTIQRIAQGYTMWKSFVISSTLTSIFTFIMIYAELFSSYITFGISMTLWLISVIMVLSKR